MKCNSIWSKGLVSEEHGGQVFTFDIKLDDLKWEVLTLGKYQRSIKMLLDENEIAGVLRLKIVYLGLFMLL